MSGIVSGIGHFFQAILEVIQGALSSVVWVIQSTFELAFGLVANIAGFFEHAIGFLLQNIVIIGVLVALAVAFLAFSGRQGKSIKRS